MDVVLAELKPHPRNYNRHSEAQIGRLVESLRRFGQPKEIVIDSSGVCDRRAWDRGGGATVEVADAAGQ